MKKQEEFTEEGDEEGGGIYEDRRARAPYAAKDVPRGNRYPKTNPRRTPAGQIVTLQCHRRTSPSKLARSYRLE